MKLRLTLLACLITVGSARAEPPPNPGFDPQDDLLSLHYDHAPDKDDGQSAAADRTVLESLYGRAWLPAHTLAVSGTYGLNKDDFNADSDRVMDMVFGDIGGWLSAHRDWKGTREKLADRWLEAIEAGGDVWVKEGGQSDLTADVVRTLLSRISNLPTRERVHVVQHSNWNEEKTSPDALDYVRTWTDYIRIGDANAYLNLAGGNHEFLVEEVACDWYAVSHQQFIGGATGPGNVDAVGSDLLCLGYQLLICRCRRYHLRENGLVPVNDDVDLVGLQHAHVHFASPGIGSAE